MVFALVITFALLEIGLRLGCFIILSLQERRNTASLRQKGEYRILCLGESTTSNQYPAILEEILNKKNIGIKFSVIDRGIVGNKTWKILSSLEVNLNAYHPDMVITMMGSNDYGEHMQYDNVSDSRVVIFLKSFRTYKLVRLLWIHIVTRFKELSASSGRKKSILPQIEARQGYTEEKDIPLSKELLKFKKTIELSHINYRPNLNELGLWAPSSFSETDKPSEEISELNPSEKAYFGLGWSYHAKGRFSKAEELFQKVIELNPKNDQAYFGLGWSYYAKGRFSEVEESFKKAIEINPKSMRAYFELARFYQLQRRLSEMEELLKKAIEINPKSMRAYCELAGLYQLWSRFPEAEESFKKAIELNYKSERAYFGLGLLYLEQARFSESEESFKEVIELNPKNDQAYFGLGWSYRAEGRFSEAEESFKKAIEINPKSMRAYFELAGFYQLQRRLSEMEELLKKAIEINPRDNQPYRALEVLYIEMGNLMLAKEYGKKAEELRSNYYHPVTINNYHELKAILDKRGIIYVCMQYPMRKLLPLKKIFQGNDQGIIFVDNEKIFKDAVAKDGYKEYFRDMFGGDFGHCTTKGNMLLAENIAKVILKEVFDR